MRPVGQCAWVARVAAADPLREAIVGPNYRLSYLEFAQLIERTAEGLAAAGLTPGARVAYMGLPGAGFLISELATQQVGGVWLGINPRYTEAEIAYVLGDARPTLLVVETMVGEEMVGRARAAAQRVDPAPTFQLVDHLAEIADVPHGLFKPRQPLPHEVALIVYTSGTTGEPKGACLTHNGIVEASRLYAERYAHPGLRSLLNLPVNHVGSLIDLAASALAQGGTLVTMPGFDPGVIPDMMREERLTLLGQVPAMHLAIQAASPYRPADFPHLKHLVWSGAAMPRPWIEANHGQGVELSTCYGQTECTGAVTFTDADADIDTLATTVGRPASPDLVRIVGEDGRPVEDGRTGEVQICGPLLMRGYFNRDAATAETLIEGGWLRTGDLGAVDEHGSLRLVGRLKEMYKSGGYNVYPREIEAVLESMPGIHAAAVISVSDERWQEVGWAYCIATPDVRTKAVLDFARRRLANYKLPKRIILRSELPLLPIGKIDKRALKALASEHTDD